MDDNFKKWACSFSGCDGGYVKADTWLCGIEWGGGGVKGYYQNSLREQISRGYIDAPMDSFDWKESIGYPYGVSFAKLYTAIQGGDVVDYANVLNLSGKELFKLNLYPIAFNSTSHQLWHEHNLDCITGFESKYVFNVWCFFNRFPFFTKLREEHKPKLIICTGVNYLKEFLMFFGGSNILDKVNTGNLELSLDSVSNQYIRQYYWIKLQPDTLLVVIPFLGGRYGLNSNLLLQEMGCRIKQLMV